MPRAKRSVEGRRRRRQTLKQARGYYSARGHHLRAAREQLLHSGVYAYRDRRRRKRDFRRLWIARINAAARQQGLSYSSLVSGLREAQIEVDRKHLAELAVNEPETFSSLAEIAKRHGRPAGAG